MRRSLPLLLVAASLFAQQAMPIPVAAPPGWIVGDDHGFQMFRPADLAPGASLVILISPSAAGPETLDEILDAGKRSVGAGAGFDGGPQPVTGRSRGGWDFKYAVWDFQSGPEKFACIVAALRRENHNQNQIQMGYLYARADSAATLQKYASAFNNILDSVGVENQVPPTPPASRNSANIQGLFGVYSGLQRGLSATDAGNAYGDSASLIVFFTDGTYRQGLPLRGYPSDLAFDRSAVPSRWGAWTQSATEIVARRDRELTKFAATSDEILTDTGRNRKWKKLAPFPDGMRVEGSFVRADGDRSPAAARIVFRADGTFQTKGPFGQMVGSLSNIVEPRNYRPPNVPYGGTDPIWQPGEGAYEFRGFSLTLRHRDGRVLQFAVHLPAGQDPRSPRFLVMGESYVMAKQ